LLLRWWWWFFEIQKVERSDLEAENARNGVEIKISKNKAKIKIN
jgi:hypothetical protein